MTPLRLKRHMQRYTLFIVRHAVALSLIAMALLAGGITAAMAEQAPPPAPAGAWHHHWGHGPGGRGPMGDHFRHMCMDMDARRAAMLAFAEVKLGITQSEQPAWDKFVAAAKDADAPLRQVCGQYARADEPHTLPDRLARADAIASARLDMLHRLRPAVLDLYQTLTPAQRQIADRFGPGGGPGPM